MKKSEILEYGKTCNFELDKEVKDLSGNTFFSLRNPTTDLTPIYRDLYFRKIISWVLSETLEASHVVKCSVFTTVCFVCSLSS